MYLTNNSYLASYWSLYRLSAMTSELYGNHCMACLTSSQHMISLPVVTFLQTEQESMQASICLAYTVI